MSKPRSRQPAKDERKARRSLVELAAMAASIGVHDDPSALDPASIATSPDATPRLALDEQTFDTTTNNLIDVPASGQPAEMTSDPLPDPTAKATAKIDRSKVQPAEDYQIRALEEVEVSMPAAFDDAKHPANIRKPTDAKSIILADDEGQGSADSENGFLMVLAAAAAYRAKAFELMNANMNTTFEYARQLVRVRTPSEFVELSNTHARKQFELFLKQTGELPLAL